MKMVFTRFAVTGLLGFWWAILSLPVISAQTAPQKPAEAQDDIIRVNTELVQTDVMVFDKQGHFVDGLKSDQFALKVDDKATPITFFERVAAGKAGTDQTTGRSDTAT